MKRMICVFICLVLVLSASSALALNYQQHFVNEATFETLEEARSNAVTFLENAMPDRKYMLDPVLDNYPAGTTWVYRSADMFHCLSAAFRMNTNFLVYTEERFEDKAQARAYLEKLGLIDLCDAATGSIILVTPITAVSEGPSGVSGGFAQADQYAFYQLQAAMTNMGYSITNAEGVKVYYAENAYFGGLTYRYLIGIEGGATFVNNYVATVLDDVSRIAGMLLFGGSVDELRQVAGYVPVYLVNAPKNVIKKYKAANCVDAYTYAGDEETFYCQAWPLRCVKTLPEAEISAEFIQGVYYDFLINAMRIPVIKNAVNGSSSPYSAYNMNQAPYSLCRRNALINGVTKDGIYLTEHYSDTQFKDIFADSTGEYLDTWFEFLPEEVVNHTAPEHSVPLWLAVHGGDDDPVQFVDEIGLLDLAGQERFAMVAPAYQKLWRTTPVMAEALGAVTRYMLDTYPELDPSRVYTTGYSMGGGSSATALASYPDLFAAGVSMASGTTFIGDEEQVALIEKIGMPLMIVTSTYDVYYRGRPNDGILAALNRYCGYNGIPEHEYDFDQYPLVGFKGDLYSFTTLNDEYGNHTWYRCTADGQPRVALNLTEDLQHALYPEYGRIAWEFCKHFSRDPETGSLSYTPDER